MPKRDELQRILVRGDPEGVARLPLRTAPQIAATSYMAFDRQLGIRLIVAA